jgi:hypothetical protein
LVGLTLLRLLVMVLLTGCAASAHAPPPAVPFLRPDPSASSGRAAELAGLPTVPPYDDTAQGLRHASVCDPAGHVLSGTQYYAVGGTHSVTGSQLQLTSAHGAAAYSYAIYRLEATGLADESIHVELDSIWGPGGSCWYALSDYANDRWDIKRNLTYSDLTLAALAEHQTASGAVYVALLSYGGSQMEVLSLRRNGSDPGAVPPPEAEALTVGPGKTYATIEAAYAAAPATGGATILVYAQAGNAPYIQPALQVYKPGIVFWGVGAPAGERVRLDGSGYNYTGAGSTPRAIFQFNPGADDGVVRGFELYDAHNDSYNGAGVRINQANHVRVIDCEVHTCDMGIMSNGRVSEGTAADQWIAHCSIHGNGNLSDPGYNHNLYLGGTSVTLHACEVYSSLTGHNVKSRAHFNRVQYCYIHDSANRELDLVDDAGNTDQPNSHSVLLGNVIVKDPNCPGNRNVIHFGQDGGNDHTGSLLLWHNTIVTPFISPVVSLDAPGAGVHFVNNIVWDQGSGQNNQVVVQLSNGATLGAVHGNNNWLSSGFVVPDQDAFEPATTWLGSDGANPPFADSAAGDYHLTGSFANITDRGKLWADVMPPLTAGRTMQPGDSLPQQYAAPLCAEGRAFAGTPDLGAYEWLP